jgi:hypothetical protein
MAVGLLLLAACGTADELEPGRVTSFDGIAGTVYERQGTGEEFFFYFFEDGTWHGSSNRDLVVDRPSEIKVATFEGTTAVVTEIKGPATDCPDARYEIHVLENRNLQYLALEDTCAKRAIALNVSIWAPVP